MHYCYLSTVHMSETPKGVLIERQLNGASGTFRFISIIPIISLVKFSILTLRKAMQKSARL